MANCSVFYSTAPECVKYLQVYFMDTIYGGDYKLVVTDRYGNKYESDLVIEDDYIVIDTSIYPTDMISKYSKIRIQVLDGCNVVPITLCENDYDYIQLSFYQSNSEEENFEICCN